MDEHKIISNHWKSPTRQKKKILEQNYFSVETQKNTSEIIFSCFCKHILCD